MAIQSCETCLHARMPRLRLTLLQMLLMLMMPKTGLTTTGRWRGLLLTLGQCKGWQLTTEQRHHPFLMSMMLGFRVCLHMLVGWINPCWKLGRIQPQCMQGCLQGDSLLIQFQKVFLGNARRPVKLGFRLCVIRLARVHAVRAIPACLMSNANEYCSLALAY